MKKAMIAIVIALIVIIGLGSSMFTVRENEYACTVRFSEIIDTTSEAGLHFKVPFIDSIKYFSKATMLYDIPPSEVLTSDKQNMTVDCYVLWKIGSQEVLSDPGQHHCCRAASGCADLQRAEDGDGYPGPGGHHQHERWR